MWKMTTAEGAVNFACVRRIYTQQAQWFYCGKDYNCAVTVEFSDNEKRSIEFFDSENAAAAYVADLIEQLNKSAGVDKCQ